MGGGKTTWSINRFNSNPGDLYVFMTPFLKEMKRIRDSCPDLDFKEPDETFSKMSGFQTLLRNGENIVMTHELFSRIRLTPAIIKTIQEYGYRLVMDEVLEMIKPLDIHPDDTALLIRDGVIAVEPDGTVRWKADDYKGDFRYIKAFTENRTVFYYKEKMLLWLFPIDILTAFKEVTILTFNFAGSHIKNYLDMNNLHYEYYHIKDGSLVFGREDLSKAKSRIASLVDVYEGQLNKIGDKDYSLSSGWFHDAKNKNYWSRLEKNARNYLRSQGAKVDDALWSVYKRGNKRFKPFSIKDYSNAFCPCNSRATNEYRERTALAYLCNVFENPLVLQFFREHGVSANQDAFALCQLLQWIWRSAIRDGKPIHLYLPSYRMRTLLYEWLHDVDATNTLPLIAV